MSWPLYLGGVLTGIVLWNVIKFVWNRNHDPILSWYVSTQWLSRTGRTITVNRASGKTEVFYKKNPASKDWRRVSDDSHASWRMSRWLDEKFILAILQREKNREDAKRAENMPEYLRRKSNSPPPPRPAPKPRP